MVQFAPVAPPQMLQQLARTGDMGTYLLLLAHEVAANPIYYHEVVCNQNTTIIMDNSVVELGCPVRKEVMSLARAVFPHSILVLPDVIGNAAETLMLMNSYLSEILSSSALLGPPYMAIPQGNNLNQFLDCAKQQLRIVPHLEWWGVPRHAVAKLGTRHNLIAKLHDLNFTIKIHLMGFSDDILDDVTCTRREEVSGIDSAVPIRLGMLNRKLELDPILPVPPRGSYWIQAQYPNPFIPSIISNVRSFRRWIRAKNVPLAA